MLATSRSGERSRRWLQERIWGSRERANSQASLRRELSNLRPLVNAEGRPLLVVAHETVALDLGRVVVDVRDRQRITESRGEFLEGIDIAWEEGFEDWLREERQAIETAREDNIGADWITDAPSANAAGTGSRPTLSIIVHDDPMPADHAATIDRIADLLVERTARLRWLSLVGAPATKLKIDGPTALMRAGKALGVDYLLHCQFNPDETLTIALSQASSSRLLWSDRHALLETAGTSDPSKIANNSIAALAARIEADQVERVRGRPADQLDTHELLWRARWHMDRLTRDDARKAGELLQRAAKREPESVDVLLEQARCEVADMWATGIDPDTAGALRRKLVLARDMDPYSARTWALLGMIDLWSGRHDSAIALLHEAIRLEPSMSSAHAHLGSCYIYSGHPDDGIRVLNNAMRLNPHDTYHFHRLGQLALANLMEGNPATTVQEATAALARRPGYWLGHVYKIAGLQKEGDHAAAREAMAMFRTAKPRFDMRAIGKLPFRDSRWNDELSQALEAVTA
ncbi:tetratricopeptide repeat protein [Sphingopyxis sp. KK2]|uniref:tetratricopeptide repeat protein n=1 Tax=Sphingopyxis sp. KK2 TaxID=1855727 RepID=UPI00097E7205|nr:tetratricopeptide repeat protein [Sphingopyxis sp. KK2]